MCEGIRFKVVEVSEDGKGFGPYYTEDERLAWERECEELREQIDASKQNERRWISKGEEAIAERNAANAALEAVKKHQEIVAGTGAAQMSMTWKIAEAHLRSIGCTRPTFAAPVSKAQRCQHCGGTGYAEEEDETCAICKGSGEVPA